MCLCGSIFFFTKDYPVKQLADHRTEDDCSCEGEPVTAAGPDLVAIALNNKLLLTLGLIGGLVAGVLVYLKLGPSYLASARILVSKRTTVPVRENAENATFGERGEHVALIMSPMIVEAAVKKHKLDQLPTLANRSLLGGTPEPVQDILDLLKVKRTAGSDQSFLNVLELTYESRSPNDANTVVAAIIDSYRDYLDRTRQEYTAQNLALIRQANTDLKRELEGKEREYIEFRRTAPLQWRNAPGTDGQAGEVTNVHQDRVQAIETERRTTLLKRTEVLSKLTALEQARERGDSNETVELLVRRFLNFGGTNPQTNQREGSAIATLGGNSALVALETRLLPLFLEEKRLLRDYGPNHPDVKAVRNNIEATREFYRQQGVTVPDSLAGAAGTNAATAGVVSLVDVYITSLKQELAELENRDRELSILFEDESRAAKEFSHYQLQDQKLNGEIKRLNTMWESMVSRLSEATIVKDTGGYTLQVVAEPRDELAFKRTLKIVGGVTALGAVLAFGLAYLRTLRDSTLKNTEEVRQWLGLSVLGGVPEIDVKAVRVRENTSLAPSLAYFHSPGTPAAEACRSVRSALLASAHAADAKVIQLTSPETQDGKSLLIANLAVALAQSGRKVLLVDADLRRPTLHTLFGLRQEIGLSDVLAAEIDIPNAIHTTEVNGLSLIGSGLSPANPAEMLSSPRFEQLLRDVRDDFDFVLVDTPPVLAVSDPSIVAAHTDAVLLVLRLGKSRRDRTKRARETLGTHGARLLGVVVNGAEPPANYGDAYARPVRAKAAVLETSSAVLEPATTSV